MPNVLARVSSSVHAVISDKTATRVPYPVAKNSTAVVTISFVEDRNVSKVLLTENETSDRGRQTHADGTNGQNSKAGRYDIIIDDLRSNVPS